MLIGVMRDRPFVTVAASFLSFTLRGSASV
jgi:hypothetical protein